jgi:hypothetical protein
MIEETIQIHDKYQFEIKLGYALAPDKRITSYDVETYIFFPNNLGINRYTYKHNDFYNDIQAYIRLKTPTVLLKDIASGPHNSLERLKVYFHQLVSQPNKATIANYEYQIKMFCCILKSAIRDHVYFISTKVNTRDIEDLITKYLDSIHEINLKFRELRSIINVPIIDGKIFSIYLFADEYLSLLIESYTYELLELLKEKEITNSEEYKNKLLSLIKSEINYRKENQYPSIPDEHSDNEGLIFRSGVLKKYMGSVLFLNTRIKEEGEFLEQLVFALAAGVAMLFATAIAFFSQNKFGSFSLPLFMALVITYMFKDRIKELTRLYLWSRIHHVLFDHRMNIYSSPKNKIGWCKESFAFIKERKIPRKIMEIRDRDHITEIENGWVGEKTILYRKRIKIFRKKFTRMYHDLHVESINDIMRLNVLKFLNKMDNPKKGVYVCDGQSYRKISGRRVYHLNMIMKYSMKDKSLWKRFRIVLSRSGIKRIEEVVFDEESVK